MLTIRNIGVALLGALFCLFVTIVFFSPCFWLIGERNLGSFEWFRGVSYLTQCANPFDTHVELAMRWRLLPPMLAHLLGLSGMQALVIPWTGLLCLCTFVVYHLRKAGSTPGFYLGGTLLFTSTSACLVSLGWMGINDSWVWLGLLAVSLSRSRSCFVLACLLCPWVDERFLIGLPLATCVRFILNGSPVPNLRELFPLLFLLPYIAIRMAFGGSPVTGKVEREFFSLQAADLVKYAPFVPLGWWMGLRLAWAPVVYGIATLERPKAILLVLVTVPTLVLTVFLAADLSRSIAILSPLVIFGILRFAKMHPAQAPRVLLWAGCAALLIPAMHVVGNKLDPIDNVFVELARWYRISSGGL
jgi:hypothetical protein